MTTPLDTTHRRSIKRHYDIWNRAANDLSLAVTWGKTPSILPGETGGPASPFPAGIEFRFLMDQELVKNNPPTATLVGFGQACEPGNAVNMCVYHVAKKDQKILTAANRFEVYVHNVVTNGNVPQSWA